MDRVLIWYAGRSPAIERLTFRLVYRLRQARPHMSLSFLANGANPYLARLEAQEVRIIRTEAPSGLESPGAVLLQGPRHAMKLWQALTGLRPNLVLITMNFALAWPLVLLCRLCRTPVILMVHDPEPHAGDYAPLWQRLSQKLLIRRTQALVALSSWSAKRLLPFAKPTLVWPINLIAPRERGLPRNPQPGTPVRFLFLGRLVAYKGLDHLLDACSRLGHLDGWSLTIAGTGPLASWTQQAFVACPQVALDRLRPLSEEEIDMALATHDVVVCPYGEATQSAVVSEALYAAVPVVVSAVAGLPEQVIHDQSGLVLESPNGEDLAKAMLRLITEDGLLERLRQGAAAAVDQDAVDRAWDRQMRDVEAQLT